MKNLKKILAIALVAISLFAVTLPAMAATCKIVNGPATCYHSSTAYTGTPRCQFNTGTVVTNHGVWTLVSGVKYTLVTGYGFDSGGNWANHKGWVRDDKLMTY